MFYVIFDMEWNTVFSKKHSKYVNEIVEIGAVKLDEQFNEVGRFDRFIHSAFSNSLHSRFTELTGITNEEMLSGVSFSEAMNEFSEWVGKGSLIISWSNSDIFTLLENYQVILGLDHIPFVEKYLDAQKFVQDYLISKGEQITSQISLSNAAERLNIVTENLELHRAVDDSALTAKLFLMCYTPKAVKRFTIDTTKNDYFKKIAYRPYYLNDINDPLIKKRNLRFKCELCHKTAKRTSSWSFKNNSFRAKFKCQSCGDEFIGQVSFKKKYSSLVVKRRRLKLREKVQSPKQ